MTSNEKPFRPGQKGRPPKNAKAQLGLAADKIRKARRSLEEAEAAVERAEKEEGKKP